jgi:hypothetical protein
VKPRSVGDLCLVVYLFLVSLPLIMVLLAFALHASGASEPSTLLQFVPMGCVLFFVPAHLAAWFVLAVDLIQRRRPSGFAWGAALLFGGPPAVAAYYVLRLRPSLAGAGPNPTQLS